MNYQILKFPKGKDKFDFLYFKKYERKSEESVVLTEDEEGRTIYVCNFTAEIEIGMLKKFFGLCGSITSVKLGEFFNRTSNKR